MMLAAVGGVIGLAVGRLALSGLLQLIPDQFPAWAHFDLDARVIAFSLVSVVGAVLFFGWAPALHAVSGDLRSAVSATTAGTTGAPRGRKTLWWLVRAGVGVSAVVL